MIDHQVLELIAEVVSPQRVDLIELELESYSLFDVRLELLDCRTRPAFAAACEEFFYDRCRLASSLDVKIKNRKRR